MQRTSLAYQVLGVTPDASTDDIHRAFRKLAFDWHPDRHPNCPEATHRFQEIVGAYRLLRQLHTNKAAGATLHTGRLPFWAMHPVRFAGRQRWGSVWRQRAISVIQRYGVVLVLFFSAGTAMAITAIGLREPASLRADLASSSAFNEAMVSSMRQRPDANIDAAAIETGTPMP